MKTCSTCYKRKPESDFYKNLAYKDGMACSCKKCRRKVGRIRYHGNLEYFRRYTNNNTKRYNRNLKRQIISAYGNKCTCCGETEERFLTLEHKNHDRAEHIKKLGYAAYIYRDVRKQGFPKDKYTILCMNCNFATRLGNICPHRESQDA